MSDERVASGSPYEQTVGFSRAVRTGRHVYVSGTAPIWPDGHVDPRPARAGPPLLGDRPRRARPARRVAGGRGAHPHVPHRPQLRGPASQAHGEVFADVRPASTMLVVVGMLDPRWVVEVELDAVLPD